MRLIALLAMLLLGFAPAVMAETSKPAQAGFDHVMATRTLRCAYAPLPPFLIVDPATKKISGLIYDVTNEMGKRLGVKVDWTEEAGYGEIATGMATGRYDAFCGVLWQTPSRAGAMSFSAPIYKTKVFPCVRGDSTAYDTSSAALNAPDKTFGGYDGDVSSQMAQTLFPLAKLQSFPATMSFAEAMQNIVTKKIDAIATCSPISADAFNKANPGALKVADPAHPITIVPVALGLPLGDTRLKGMTDTALFAMTADGTMEKLFRQYVAKYIDNTVILPKPY